MQIRTRFAPSPTGFMHVGGVRTALFAWLVARQAKGQFILRIEDTDKARKVKGSEAHILESLRWLGLEWDEGPGQDGPRGPYRQSERLSIYQEWAHKLVAKGLAYGDPFTSQELDELRQKAVSQKKPFLFREHRPEKLPNWGNKQALRFKSNPKNYSWHDQVMGNLNTGPEAVDDFILIKSDGYPTYNFAHIIDDHLMEITHVIRSQEFLSSVPRFLNLYEALGFDAPVLATLPYVMAVDGKKKLSKRDGAKDILDYAREGYLPDAVLNFLATLGWNDGTEQEIFSSRELIKKFSLKRVQKGGARFDEQRLKWLNGQHIRRLPLGELSKRAVGFWPPAASGADEPYKEAVLSAVQERLKFLAELPDLTYFFFEEPSQPKVQALYVNPVDKQLKNLDPSHYPEILHSVIKTLSGSDFSHDDLATRLNGLLEELQTKPGILFSIVRIALTGSQAAPTLFDTLHVLGKESSLGRLKIAHSALPPR